MSFVAEPYEHIADDLMTALTGGVVREEHRFDGPERAYVLGTPGAIAASVKVVGQRDEQFRVFELGIDYDYDAGEEGIRWKPEGRSPDPRTYFYINYYPAEARRRLTDRNPGSVVSTLSSAYARVLAVTNKQMELIYRSAFLDLTEGMALDHVAALFGLERKDARYSSGEVLVRRSTPAPADIAIPSGTLVSTERGDTFETTEKRTLRRGQLSVVAPIRAQAEGVAGQVPAGTITIINRPIFGIDAVTNESATVFAAGKEPDPEFKRRVKGALERAGKATVDAVKYALIEDLPEITETNIQIVESAPGTVEVRLGVDAAGNVDLVRRVEESIFSSRPAGVRVTHNLPASGAPAVAGAAITRGEAVGDFRAANEPAGLVEIDAEVLAAMPDGVLDLRVEVLLRLTERNLTAAQKEAIEDEARRTVMQYIEELPMGAPLIYHKLLGRVVQPDTVADAVVLIGARTSGPFEGFRANLATKGRKARADLYQVFVGLMDEIVSIDVRVFVEGDRTPAGLDSALRDELARTLSGARGRVAADVLRSAVRDVVKRAGAELIEQGAVSVSAEFEETGRLLADASEVLLAEHEVVLLRDVSVDVKGALGG